MDPDDGDSPAGPVPARLADAVRRAASELTGVPADEVFLLDAEFRTWPDGALGCPQPGMAYPQVLVEGWRIVVRAGDRTLDYRARNADRLRLCRERTDAAG